jgi:hypothetical protein
MVLIIEKGAFVPAVSPVSCGRYRHMKVEAGAKTHDRRYDLLRIDTHGLAPAGLMKEAMCLHLLWNTN